MESSRCWDGRTTTELTGCVYSSELFVGSVSNISYVGRHWDGNSNRLVINLSVKSSWLGRRIEWDVEPQWELEWGLSWIIQFHWVWSPRSEDVNKRPPRLWGPSRVLYPILYNEWTVCRRFRRSLSRTVYGVREPPVSRLQTCFGVDLWKWTSGTTGVVLFGTLVKRYLGPRPFLKGEDTWRWSVTLKISLVTVPTTGLARCKRWRLSRETQS